jgi:hypothetical protein
MTTRQKVVSIAGKTIARARIAGKAAAKRLLIATDAALVEQGKAARARQRKRAAKAALKKAAKAVVIAGAAVATVMAMRAAKAAPPRRG